MTNNVSRIASAVDDFRDELISFLQKLVQTPSLPGQEQNAQRLVASKLRSLGLAVDVISSELSDLQGHPAFCDDGVPFHDRLNVVGRWPASGEPSNGGNPRSLILNGHIDVVPTGSETLWADSPWSGTIREGQLYGRGSCDMKAGVTANIFAIQVLQSLGFRPAADILVESVIGEESGGAGTLTTIVKGFKADAAIITEPTRLHLCPVQSGALTFRIRVAGRAIHACMKPYGVSAIEKFYVLLQSVQQLERRRHVEYKNPLYEDPNNIAPVNFGTLRAGDWPSTVPDELVVEGRFGVLPGESTDAARQAMAAALTSAAREDSWLVEHPPALEWFEGQFESGETPQDSPIVRAIGEGHEQTFGKAPVVQGVTYGSDLRLFTNHGGFPAVLYGPGNILDAHTVDEHVDLEEVIAATKALAHIVTKWCGGEFA
ncbi:MAG TPA: ArgE/DapE family deacylase [Terriglobales bacterium]|nr:ArgE/DapE family deacylase [Terriglobales bacterium]